MTDIEFDRREDASSAKNKGGGMVVTIGAVAALSLLGAGGGWLVGGMLAPGLKNAQQDQQEANHGAAASKDKGTEKAGREDKKLRPNLLPLAPITTNLSYPSDNWVRIEVALMFRDDPDEVLADRINEDILSYLRTVSLQQIEGPRGFQYLHDDLVERARLRSEGRVTDVVFRTFVIE